MEGIRPKGYDARVEQLLYRPSRSTILATIAAFFALTFVTFGPTLFSTFVLWDDTYLIYANPDIKGFSLRNLHAIFSTFDPELYVPITLLSYQLDFTIAGMEPFIFHLHNLILHTLNALLVTWILAHWTGRRSLALLGGLLFAVHPLQTEAVAWASARKDVLSSLFFLLSLLGYIHMRIRNARLPYYGSLVAFTLGLLTKVSIVMLPIILVLMDIRERRPLSKRMIMEKLPYFALSLVFGFIALFGKRDVVAVTTTAEKALMAGKSTVFYLEKLLWPTGLSALYPFEGKITVSSPEFWVPLLILCALSIAVLLSLRRTREIFFGAGFFFLMLLPSFSNFAKGGTLYVASDRYIYLPIIGLLLLCVEGWEMLRQRTLHSLPHDTKRMVSVGVPSSLVLTLSILAHAQTSIWQDSFSLFHRALDIAPRALAAHTNLGVAYRKVGDLDRAMEHLEQALAIRPSARIYTAMAAIDIQKGNFDRAIDRCRKAALLDPRDPEPLYGLALAFAEKHDQAQAFALYEQTLSLEPKHVAAHNNIAAMYLERGDLPKALEHYEAALRFDPFFEQAAFNLGIVYERLGRDVEAARSFARAAEIEGDTVDVLMRMVTLYAQMNDRPNTINALQRILRLEPAHPFATKMLNALTTAQ